MFQLLLLLVAKFLIKVLLFEVDVLLLCLNVLNQLEHFMLIYSLVSFEIVYSWSGISLVWDVPLLLVLGLVEWCDLVTYGKTSIVGQA
jgi:hypothetical protein